MESAAITIRARIPGEPVAQGRPKAFKTPAGFVRVYDPAKSRNWKATAHEHFRMALEAARVTRPITGPVWCEIIAVFSCPKSQWRTKTRTPRRPHAKKPDAENVAKAVLDAATGVVWLDDSQVTDLRIRKVIGEQGEAPYVQVSVTSARVPAREEGGECRSVQSRLI